jgi:hypothetical protein
LLAVTLAGAGCTSSAATQPSNAVPDGPAVATPLAKAAGTVTVTSDGKVVCVITIKAGQGTCQVNTLKYPVGTLKFNGSYSGSTGFRSSKSATISVKLRKAPTKTALSLSAGKLTYGDEKAERLAVRVVPQYTGTPAGKVTVRAGGTVVCVITLASGAGSCVLKSTELAAGSYPLIASYPGSAQFNASTSAKHTLAVAK